MSKLMELVEEYGREVASGYVSSNCNDDAILSKIRAAVAELERDAARYAHIISRIAQSELETVIRREHDDDGEYTTGLVQMIDAAMEAEK